MNPDNMMLHSPLKGWTLVKAGWDDGLRLKSDSWGSNLKCQSVVQEFLQRCILDCHGSKSTYTCSWCH